MVYSTDAAWCVAFREIRFGSTYPSAVEMICACGVSSVKFLYCEVPDTFHNKRFEQHTPAKQTSLGSHKDSSRGAKG